MITIGMNYEVLPGKEEVFETTFHKILNTMEHIEGHTSSRMFRDVDDRHQYIILSEWSDRGAFDSFIASEDFRSVTAWGKEEILADRPMHKYYDH